MDLWGFPWGAHGYPKMDASWNIPWEHPMKWMLCTVWERLFDHWTFSSRTYRQADKCEWLREGLKSVRHLVLDEALRNWTSRHVADMSHPEMPCPERLTGLSSRDTSKSWIKSWNFCGSEAPSKTSGSIRTILFPRYQSVERLQQLPGKTCKDNDPAYLVAHPT